MFQAITLMNILIGIVVEVISNVAIAERRPVMPVAPDLIPGRFRYGGFLEMVDNG